MLGHRTADARRRHKLRMLVPVLVSAFVALMFAAAPAGASGLSPAASQAPTATSGTQATQQQVTKSQVTKQATKKKATKKKKRKKWKPTPVATNTVYGANWQMNETSGKMLDSSGNNNNSSKIMSGITQTGSYYHFTGLGSVIVPASPSLQPGDRSFSVSAMVRLDESGIDQNFVQKGGLSTTLGQWKIEISGKHVHCRIAGDQGMASIWVWGVGPSMVGTWHQITCTKYPDHVTLAFGVRDPTTGQVKILQTHTQQVIVGSVTTPRNVTIGGKGFGCGDDCDYMMGDIDWATLTYF